MSTNAQLRVSDLDFDSIKANLKEFLSTKNEFKDYDFEGSGMSVLLDVLAYNTHYEALIANQLAQELTIDTARNETIVGLHAKRLGYTPRSWRAARANVNLEIINPLYLPATLTIGRGASFISSSDGVVTNFTTISPRTISPVNGRYIFTDLEIAQGKLKTYRYTFSNDLKKFEIPDDNVDLSLMRVLVQESLTSSVTTEYKSKVRLTDVTATSLTYYTQINQRGKFEIYFGDGILGKQPDVGNIIILEYVTTDGPLGNDVQSFSFNDYVEGNSNAVVTTSSKSYGGAEKESIDSVRFNAYKNTMSQDRAVTQTDYANIISQIYPLDAISVWGGEQNVPPAYGKVFVSIKPIDSDSVLTEDNKSDIKNALKSSHSVVTVTPEFVDVDYLYIDPSIVVYIDDTKSNTSTDFIKTLVTSFVSSYSDLYLEKFDKIFRFSKFTAAIDTIDSSILSNITNLRFYKKFTPLLGVSDSYVINFNNPIESGSMTSTPFNMFGSSENLYLSDNDGSIDVIFYENGIKRSLYSGVGTINYSTGAIGLNDVFFTAIPGTFLEISGSPASPDIISLRNTIVLIDKTKIKVNVIIESKDYNEHQFSTTR